VNPARSANSTHAEVAFLAAQRCPLGLALQGGGQLRRHVLAKQVVPAAQLPCGPRQQRGVLAAHALGAEPRQDPVHRPGAS
jgi:hypothetical protein